MYCPLWPRLFNAVDLTNIILKNHEASDILSQRHCEAVDKTVRDQTGHAQWDFLLCFNTTEPPKDMGIFYIIVRQALMEKKNLEKAHNIRHNQSCQKIKHLQKITILSSIFLISLMLIDI